MLLVASALKGYAIEAQDGRIGVVDDFLFDDETWRVRWLVVDTGTWLADRKVLVHPSAIGQADYERRELPVTLTKAQVEASPNILHNEPVSRQMETNLYDYYHWSPLWGGGEYLGTGLGIGAGSIAAPLSSVPFLAGASLHASSNGELIKDKQDPHLRSVIAVTGYHIHAADGAIGHIENFLMEDKNWEIRYFIVDTRNWWPGQHVLVSPYALASIDWGSREVRLNISQEKVRSSPSWDPIQMTDRAFQARLHEHYNWPGSAFY